MRFKKLQLLTAIGLVVIVLLPGCHKSNEASLAAAPNGLNFFGLIESTAGSAEIKRSGTFFFESNLANNDTSLNNIVDVGGSFYDANGNAQIDPGSASIGDYQLTFDNVGAYILSKPLPIRDFFGKKIKFSLTPPPVGNINVPVVDSLYSPQAIYITSIPRITALVIKKNASTTITWNADPANKNGVVINAEYLPTLYANRTALANGYKAVLNNSVIVPDNGSITLSASFFSGYPTGPAQIAIWVARGSFKIVKSGNNNYEIGGYTAAAIWQVSIEE